jgi:hypothetical protein
MNDIETHVLELIGESTSSPDVFTDDATGMAPIRDSINDAIEEISMLTGSYKRNYRLFCVSGQNFYRFRFTKDSMAWITDAWVSGLRRRLEQYDPIRMVGENPRWLFNSGNPVVYMPIGLDVVALWPAPADESLYIDFTMVMIPGRYAEDTDRIKLKDSFKWAAANYAVSEYYASRGDAKQAIYYWQKYLEGLGLQVMYPKAAEKPWRAKSQDVVR